MDEMKIISKFTRNMISKILKVMLKKKSGYNVDIQINDVNVTINEGKTHVHLDVDAELDKDELMKLIKNFGLN